MTTATRTVQEWQRWRTYGETIEIGGPAKITLAPKPPDEGWDIVPAVVLQVGAHWSDQPAGEAGYHVLVEGRVPTDRQTDAERLAEDHAELEAMAEAEAAE